MKEDAPLLARGLGPSFREQLVDEGAVARDVREEVRSWAAAVVGLTAGRGAPARADPP